jgi:cell division protein FtsQ
VRAAAATLRLLPRVVVGAPRAIGLSPHWRRRLVALGLLACVLGAGYVFWLRDSSLVQVEHVTVTGLDTPDAARVRAELTVAARRMTTLHVDEAALRRAVAGEPIVQSLSVESSFPHALTIQVVENRPVAMLVAGGRQVAVAPDGTVLRGARAESGLPAVRVGSLPTGDRLPEGTARDRVAVAAAAPPRLLSRVASISIQRGRGAVAQLQHGPAIYFGLPIGLARKWEAAAAVLAQRSSQGATYIDVRMPDRPVAGGLGLQEQPQAEAQPPPPGSPPGSPDVLPADPGAAPPTAGAAAPAQPQPPAAPVQTAPATTASTPSGAAAAPATTAQSTSTNTGP